MFQVPPPPKRGEKIYPEQLSWNIGTKEHHCNINDLAGFEKEHSGEQWPKIENKRWGNKFSTVLTT
jgi:hypothetical protein